jgi:hypothetical protein
MSDGPGAWALLFAARALRQRGGHPHAVTTRWIAKVLCRFGLHKWSLASPRYFVCTRCGKTKGM